MAKVHQEATSYVLIDWMGGGRTGRENMWLEVRTYGPSAARYMRPDREPNTFRSGPTWLSCVFCFFFWRSENSSMAAFASFRARLSQQPYAFFRPYHLARTALIRNFFHMAFQRNCARERTGHMIIHLINLACVAGLNYVCVAELVWYLPKITRYSRYISAITAKSKSCLESVWQQAFIFSFSVLPWYIITVLAILGTTSAVVIQNRNWYCRRVRMIWSGHR